MHKTRRKVSQFYHYTTRDYFGGFKDNNNVILYKLAMWAPLRSASGDGSLDDKLYLTSWPDERTNFSSVEWRCRLSNDKRLLFSNQLLSVMCC